MENNKKYEEMETIETAAEEAGAEEIKPEEIKAEEISQPEKKAKKFSAKKKIGLAVVAAAVLGIISLLAMSLMSVDYMEARQKVLAYTGPNSQIISEESDNEFLFLNEYSFEVSSDRGYYEIKVNPFGKITSVEHSNLWN